MKIKSILVLAIALLAATLTGCAAPVLQKSQVVVAKTNDVRQISVVTNSAGAVVSAATNVFPVVTLFTNDVWEVSSQTVGYVQSAQGVASTVAAIVPPAAPVVSVVNVLGGLALALLGVYARAKTALAAKHADALEKSSTMLRAVISGVEVANQPTVKAAIAEHASVLNVATALNEVVQGVSGGLLPRS